MAYDDVTRSRPRAQADLNAVVEALRSRLIVEHVLRWTLRGLAVGLLGLAVGALIVWALRLPVDPLLAGLLLAAPILGACAYAAMRRPSPARAARVADRRLALEERLSTAVELAAAGSTSPLAAAQILNAIAATRAARLRWPTIAASLRRELMTTAGVAAIAGGALGLLIVGERLQIPRPALSGIVQAGQIAVSAPEASLQSRADAALNLTPAAQQPGRAQEELRKALSAPDQAAKPGANGSQSQTDLNRRAQQSRQQNQALDNLAQALNRVSAGASAAEAIQRGEFDRAGAELSNLGDQADQLSEAAKQELAQALQEAADKTQASNPSLAAREREAADALVNGDYAAQREALRNLGEEVARGGQGIEQQGQLADQMDALQRQGGDQGAANAPQPFDGQRSGDSVAQGSPDGQGAPANQAGDPQGESGTGSAAGQGEGGNAPSGQQVQAPDGTTGQNGQGGVGGERPSTLDPNGAPPGLDVAGRPVEVPVKAGSGPSRDVPAEPGTEGTVTDGGASTGSGGAAPEQDPGVIVPEQNSVPTDRRETIKAYFNGDGTE